MSVFLHTSSGWVNYFLSMQFPLFILFGHSDTLIDYWPMNYSNWGLPEVFSSVLSNTAKTNIILCEEKK